MPPKKQYDKYPEGEVGDFYVINGECTSCGAPEMQAPDLIAHSNGYYNHCYFKKQPCTPAELTQAIKALEVACTSSIRYGGRDEAILKRMYERGLSAECDHQPIGSYNTIIKNQVQFHYTGVWRGFPRKIMYPLLRKYPWLKSKIVHFNTNSTDHFTFTHRSRPFSSGMIYTGHLSHDSKYTILITIEKDASWNNVIYAAIELNKLLLQIQGISHLIWFDMDGNQYPESTEIY